MKISKLKAIFALLLGGPVGLIKYALGIFNEQVLSKIPNKEVGVKYIKDTLAVSCLLRTILENHEDSISEKRKAVIGAILAALEELAKALEDFEVNQNEIDSIVEKVQKAISTWKQKD